MKRVIALALLGSAAVFVVAVNTSVGHGNGHHAGGHKIAVVEHATTDAVTNGDPTTDIAGNILTFANDVYNAADAHKVGTDQGSCVRTVVGKSWECAWTTFLPSGQITVEGPFSDTGDTVLAITGGTGAYRSARGEMELKYRNPAGTEFDFIFHLIG
ncbi:MAG: allene oxide cyclase family protein [Solirubrobacterales bacterium]